MDSSYAHGVCHLFRSLWKQRGFKKTDGTPVQHLQQIKELMVTLMMPSKMAVIKCQAHQKANDFVIKGNNAADEAAREASGCQAAIILLQW